MPAPTEPTAGRAVHRLGRDPARELVWAVQRVAAPRHLRSHGQSALSPPARALRNHQVPVSRRQSDRKMKRGIWQWPHAEDTVARVRFETLEEAKSAYLDRWDARWADTRITVRCAAHRVCPSSHRRPHSLPRRRERCPAHPRLLALAKKHGPTVVEDAGNAALDIALPTCLSLCPPLPRTPTAGGDAALGRSAHPLSQSLPRSHRSHDTRPVMNLVELDLALRQNCLSNMPLPSSKTAAREGSPTGAQVEDARVFR